TQCRAHCVLAQDGPGAVPSLGGPSVPRRGEPSSIDDALFLHSEMLRSPMGANLTAFRSDAMTPAALVNSFGGVVMTWDEVLEHVRSSGHVHMNGGGMHDSRAHAAPDSTDHAPAHSPEHEAPQPQ